MQNKPRSTANNVAFITATEREKRSVAVEYARGSVALEGFALSADIKALNASYVAGECSDIEHTQRALSLALAASNKEASARDEGAAAFVRIKELYHRPVEGSFDTAHLLEVHRRIFQDLPHHGPGGYRPDAPGHCKVRGLDSSRMVYEVPYARGREIAARLSETLQAGLLQELREADHETFVARMARLYGDLDYAHPFREGNSRTLREFTRELAQAAGKIMHWHHIAARMQGRDLLYLARDAEIFRRHFPGIDDANYQPKGITVHEAKYLLTLEGKAYPTLAKAIQMTMEPPPKSAR